MGEINYVPSDSGMTALSSNLSDLMKSMEGIHKQQETITSMLLDVDGTLIRHIDNPSEEMMLAAVKQNGMAIQHILPMKQTEEIKWAAIKSNPYCIGFVYKPSLTMWEEVVKFEYDEDDENIEKHPVHLIKDSNIKETVARISLYTSFIDSNPYDFSYIIKDISSEKDKNIEVLTWRYFLMNYDYTSCINLCPDKVMDQIVDDLIDKQPIVLKRLHIKYWTLERAKKLLKESPSDIRNVPHSIFPDEIGELYGETKSEEQTDQYIFPDFDHTAALCGNLSVIQYGPYDEGEYKDSDAAEPEADRRQHESASRFLQRSGVPDLYG